MSDDKTTPLLPCPPAGTVTVQTHVHARGGGQGNSTQSTTCANSSRAVTAPAFVRLETGGDSEPALNVEGDPSFFGTGCRLHVSPDLLLTFANTGHPRGPPAALAKIDEIKT
ncbi:MAG: hypothetical protein ACYTFN_18135 [Planctomycetota bacterium]|jgi:hypothetical protein